MNSSKLFIFSIIIFSFLFINLLSAPETFAGQEMPFNWRFPETDSTEDKLAAVFDLRDRETYLQLTNTGIDLGAQQAEPINNPNNITVHVQIFNVAEDCQENNFFDVYTPADTHVYNMRDILTNDGNPSGVDLPDNAYGIVVFSVVEFAGGEFDTGTDQLLGNIRILDTFGYEYRTNIASDTVNAQRFFPDETNPSVTFNFNTLGGVTLSDVMGFNFIENGDTPGEVEISNVLDVYTGWNLDIFNNNEVPQSCRNVIFACITPDSQLQESLLEEVADENDGFSANIASFEYGINEAIPHSRGGELLCPSNFTSEGFVKMQLQTFEISDNSPNFDRSEHFIAYIGLNNGNGRGSFDSVWYEQLFDFDS